MVQLEANLMDKDITLASPRALLQVTESLSSFRPLIILNFISVCVCSKVLNWLNVILKEKKIELKARSNIKHEMEILKVLGSAWSFILVKERSRKQWKPPEVLKVEKKVKVKVYERVEGRKKVKVKVSGSVEGRKKWKWKSPDVLKVLKDARGSTPTLL